MMTILKYIVAALALTGAACTNASAQTLKTVRDRGHLICGVNQGLPGFSAKDGKGHWSGLDVDFLPRACCDDL